MIIRLILVNIFLCVSLPNISALNAKFSNGNTILSVSFNFTGSWLNNSFSVLLYNASCYKSQLIEREINKNNLKEAAQHEFTNCTSFPLLFDSSVIGSEVNANFNICCVSSGTLYQLSVQFSSGFSENSTVFAYQQSNVVTNLRATYQFVFSILTVKWNAPLVKKSDIMAFAVAVADTMSSPMSCERWWLMTCNDCQNQVPKGIDKSFYRKCNISNGSIFSKSNSLFSLIISETGLDRSSGNAIFVRPFNAFGWGLEANCSIITGLISGKVQSLTTDSSFPSKPLTIMWTQPTEPNGEVARYLISILNGSDNSCLMKAFIDCKDCSNNITYGSSSILINKINISACRKMDNSSNWFSKTNSSFSILIKDPAILPYSDYAIVVTPLNGFGWGNESERKIKTSQYISGKVQSLTTDSSFPSKPLTIMWTQPTEPNGEVVRYLISILNGSDNSCLMKAFIDCIDCSNNITYGSSSILINKINISACRKTDISSNWFSKTNSSFSILIKDPAILPYSNYTIFVTPLNGFGWGNESEMKIKTSQYISGPVRTLTTDSSFPSKPLSIMWKPPTEPNGEVIRYLISILDGSDNSCLMKAFDNCNDCSIKISSFPSINDNISACRQIDNSSNLYSKKDVSFLIVINDSIIRPYSNYSIVVTPQNGFGQGKETKTNMKTAQFVSGKVQSLTTDSSFPSKPLSIMWTPPTEPNGEVVRYLISIFNGSDNSCLMKAFVDCSDCSNNITYGSSSILINKINISACREIDNSSNWFSKTNSSFSILIKDPAILPYSDYTIFVTPLNGFGWGNESEMKIKTSQYISGPVRTLTTDSSFPSKPLSIMWAPPTEPNGEVVRYLISIHNVSDNSCLMKAFIDCKDCSNNITNGSSSIFINKINISACREINISSNWFSKKNSSFYILIKDPAILPYSDYAIVVTPLNGFGWGNDSKVKMKTSQYKSGPVRTLTTDSSFPSKPLSIMWTPPTEPNGEVVRYLISIFNGSDNSCLMKAFVDCSDCSNNITYGSSSILINKINISACREIDNISNWFSKTNSSFSILIKDPTILPYSDYAIYVTPLNGFSWGNESERKFKTSQYISGPVQTLTTNSSFPSKPLSVMWAPPTEPNGEVVRYLISIFNGSDNSCLMKAFIDCKDCSNNITYGSSSILINKINISACREIGNSSNWFSKKNSSFSIVINDSAIKPYSNYTIFVTPLNGFGWGNESELKMKTSQYISGPVRTLTTDSSFPSKHLSVMWVPPTEPNGEVVRYLISIHNGSDNSCLMKAFIDCKDCSNNITSSIPINKINISACRKMDISSNWFLKTNSSFSILIKDPAILPYSDYTIFVTPLNGFGWGNESKVKIKTAQYISGKVQSLTTDSSFPSKPLSVMWAPPTEPNGEVVRYLISILNGSDNSCLMKAFIDCKDCSNNITYGSSSILINKINISACRKMDNSSNWFSKTNSSFSILIKDPAILPYSNYTIFVTPLNGFGWGNESEMKIKTSQYISGPVRTLTTDSSFPSKPLSIMWTPPTEPNGEVVRYLISILNGSDNSCLMKAFDNCNDCSIKISSFPSINDNISACRQIDNSSNLYSKKDVSFLIVINDSIIRPYSNYSIVVTPQNGFGQGKETKTNMKTAQFVSGKVQSLTTDSSFPSKPLSIMWAPPTEPNGEVVRYLISILNGSENSCLMKAFIDCKDCSNNITYGSSSILINKINISACREIGNSSNWFSKKNSSFSIVINDSAIKPYSNYTIFVTPLNGFGWGNENKVKNKTSQFFPSKVVNPKITGSFPKDNLQISWSSPTDPNGIIHLYLVYVYSDNKCLFLYALNCSDCSQMSGTETYQNYTCAFKSLPFSQNSTLLSFNITDKSIQPETVFNISIVAVNGYGSGPPYNLPYKTPSYAPPSPSNLSSTVLGNCLSIQWQPPEGDLSQEFSYLIFLQNQSFIKKDNATKNEMNYNFTSVEYCSTYNMCIATSSPYGVSRNNCLSNTTDLATASVDTLNAVFQSDTIFVNWTCIQTSNCKVIFQLVYLDTYSTVNDTKFYIPAVDIYRNHNITVTPNAVMPNKNPKSGKSKSILVRGRPGSPSNTRCEELSLHSLNCSWAPPLEPNGNITNYIISCKDGNNDVYSESVKNFSVVISGNVDPDILYTFQISAVNDIGTGKLSSANVTISPSWKPDIINESMVASVMASSTFKVLKETTQIAVVLPFRHFTNKSGIIKKFAMVIGYQPSDMENSTTPLKIRKKSWSDCVNNRTCPYEILLTYPEMKPTASQTRKKRETSSPLTWINSDWVIGENENCPTKGNVSCNGPLFHGTTYMIGFRAYTSAGYITISISKSTKDDPFSPIVSIVVGCLVPFVLVCLGVALYFYIRYKHNSRNPVINESMPVFESLYDASTSSSQLIDHKSPFVYEFHTNYEWMKKDSCGRMIDDFQDIKDRSKQMELQKKLVFTDGNTIKNRYDVIRPYKHNRIRLLCQDDYINASRICPQHWAMDLEKSCNCADIYIATQGPLGDSNESKTSTIGDFWRMVFENNICVIVNLTKCEENGREKCCQYWPTETNEKLTVRSYGESIDVLLQGAFENPVFFERLFLISMSGKEKNVTQLHMKTWPDHGCPTYADFTRLYASYQKIKRKNEAVVVHCSAGVGRTGTFILIDEELSRISRETDKVEIYKNLLKLRHCRCQMVQTDGQYRFIYETIHDYLVQKGLIKLLKADNPDPVSNHNQTYENPIFSQLE